MKKRSLVQRVAARAPLIGALLLGMAPTLSAAPPSETGSPPTTERQKQLEDESFDLLERSMTKVAQQQYADAMDVLLQSREKLLEAHPDGHPGILVIFNNAGLIYQRMGDYDSAITCLKAVLDEYREAFPKEQFPNGTPHLVQALMALAGAERLAGQMDSCRKHSHDALAMVEALCPESDFPEGHALLAYCLNHVGDLYMAEADYGTARDCMERSIRMRRRLNETHDSDSGRMTLAKSLSNLGLLNQAEGKFAAACECLKEALDLFQELYPEARFPNGHADVAQCLNNLGFAAHRDGEYVKAREYYATAWRQYVNAYPEHQYPDGHPDLARTLHNIAVLFEAQGERTAALESLWHAREMYEQLYPKFTYPQGHPELATCLVSLGRVLRRLDKLDTAEECLDGSLRMREMLYDEETFPNGHPDLSASLNMVGLLHKSRDEVDRAIELLERALEMNRAIYPVERYQGGHRLLAMGLNNLATALDDGGQDDRARQCYEEALDITRRIYPPESHPQGHMETAACLVNLGQWHVMRNEPNRAAGYLEEAADMMQHLATSLAISSSEAEAMNFAAALPPVQDMLISIWEQTGRPTDELYRHVWRVRGAVFRVMARRQRALLRSADPDVRQLYVRYLETSRDLDLLAVTPTHRRDPAPGDPVVLRRREYSRLKESLQRQLAAKMPGLAEDLAQLERPHTDLAKTLPPDTVFVDLVLYQHTETSSAAVKTAPRYVAYVIARGRPVRMVALPPGELIDGKVDLWRKMIKWHKTEQFKRPPLASEYDAVRTMLREWLWEPLVRAFPEGTNTVYIAADGALALLPWNALPGDGPHRFVIHDYRLAAVPNGPFLLEHLSKPANTDREGTLIALGGVRYDLPPAPFDPAEKTPPLDLLRLKPGEEGPDADYIPQSEDHVEFLQQLPGPQNVVALTGTYASAERFLHHLPRARWAMFVTHGIFNEPKMEHRTDKESFFVNTLARREERGTVFGRSPLLLSRLTFAGSSLPQPKVRYGLPMGESRRLTAEVFAGLPLDNVEMIFMAACQSAMGDIASGEGVFTLQRAFHEAGVRNTVAALWSVPVNSTIRISNLTAENYWVKKKTPLDAVRDAQLQAITELQLAAYQQNRITLLGEMPSYPELLPDLTESWAGMQFSGVGE